jgi:glyoxylase-like metal-dependent hydrolase (beta-lactamase superfamily II)
VPTELSGLIGLRRAHGTPSQARKLALQLRSISENLYCLDDSCTVYLIVAGRDAITIDAGSGSILSHLDSIGVRQIEWVLHTHHHRDQCWGTPRLRQHGARVAVPLHERHLFDRAQTYWQTRRTYDNYNNRNTFYTIGESISVDAVLEDYEFFDWRGHHFSILPAKGHTHGSSMFLVDIDGQKVAFIGDLMAHGGKLAYLHAMEYNYGCLEGLLFTLQSIQALRRHCVDIALPSHGRPITDVRGDIDRLEKRIVDCVALGKGMHVGGVWSRTETPFVPKLTLERISRHLLWSGVWACANFYVIVSRTGKALFIDYGQAFLAHLHNFADHEGLETIRFVEHRLDDLKRFGVELIDVVIPTHIHDDHTCGIPYLQRHCGTKCWALEEVATIIENPSAWASTPCLLATPISVDRRLQDGERFQWEEFAFDIYHAPGQTEFHSVIATEIDGQKIAFTGDNYFVAEVIHDGGADYLPFQSTVMRNSFQLAMHRRCAEIMRSISPNLICPGHDELLECTESEIDRYCEFIERKERVFRELVNEPADHYIDLFWARLLPYIAIVAPSEVLKYGLAVRNNLERRASYAARLLPPDGWSASSSYETIELDPGERGTLALSIQAPMSPIGERQLVTAEILIDGQTQGPVTEALVECTAYASPEPPR